MLKCGHDSSLAIISAETGDFLFCDLCNTRSERNDAVKMETELRAALTAAREAGRDALLTLAHARQLMIDIVQDERASGGVIRQRLRNYLKDACCMDATPSQQQGAGCDHRWVNQVARDGHYCERCGVSKVVRQAPKQSGEWECEPAGARCFYCSGRGFLTSANNEQRACPRCGGTGGEP